MKLGIYVAVIAAFAIAASPALKAQDMPEAQDSQTPANPKRDRESSVLASKPATESWGHA